MNAAPMALNRYQVQLGNEERNGGVRDRYLPSRGGAHDPPVSRLGAAIGGKASAPDEINWDASQDEQVTDSRSRGCKIREIDNKAFSQPLAHQVLKAFSTVSLGVMACS